MTSDYVDGVRTAPRSAPSDEWIAFLRRGGCIERTAGDQVELLRGLCQETEALLHSLKVTGPVDLSGACLVDRLAEATRGDVE